MAQDYQDMGLDQYGTKAIPISDKPKTIISSLEADSMFGEGSFPGGKLTSGPNLSTFGFPDNFDSTYPFILPYYIDSSAKVIRATLSLYFQPYRAYETAASSGGGSTSGSGGSATPTSSSGGGTTSSSTDIGHTHTVTVDNHTHIVFSGNSSGGTPANGTWGQFGSGSGTGVWVGGTASGGNSGSSGGGQTPTSSSGGGSHTHTVGDHTHTVTISDHTHSTPNHTHGITYGIYSSGYPTAVSITIDGVDVTSALGGPWSPSALDPNELDMDITNYTASAGTHTIQLTTTGQGRCIPLLIIKSVLGSKS